MAPTMDMPCTRLYATTSEPSRAIEFALFEIYMGMLSQRLTVSPCLNIPCNASHRLRTNMTHLAASALASPAPYEYE